MPRVCWRAVLGVKGWRAGASAGTSTSSHDRFADGLCEAARDAEAEPDPKAANRMTSRCKLDGCSMMTKTVFGVSQNGNEKAADETENDDVAPHGGVVRKITETVRERHRSGRDRPTCKAHRILWVPRSHLASSLKNPSIFKDIWLHTDAELADICVAVPASWNAKRFINRTFVCAEGMFGRRPKSCLQVPIATFVRVISMSVPPSALLPGCRVLGDLGRCNAMIHRLD